MRQIILITVLMLVTFITIRAQDEADSNEEASSPAISFSGSVDAYFRSNLSGDFDAAPGTSFANLPGFSLGMFNLVAAHQGDKVGFTADLVFGPRGEDAVFASPYYTPAGGSSRIVNQLFAYWNVSDMVTLTVGNFNTFLGYEVISPTSNFNYSTSYMFSYGPFSHTGVKADFDLGGGLSAMVGVFNPTDLTEFNPTTDYAYGAQVGYEEGGLGVWVNGLFSEDFYQLDLTGGYETGDLYIGVNATTAQDGFYGFAGYLQYATSESLKLGARAEYFSDQGLGLFEVPEEDVIDLTLSASYTVGQLTIIPEVRIDMFSSAIIPSGDDFEDSLSSFVLAAVYGF